jgi:hypothetical protein
VPTPHDAPALGHVDDVALVLHALERRRGLLDERVDLLHPGDVGLRGVVALLVGSVLVPILIYIFLGTFWFHFHRLRRHAAAARRGLRVDRPALRAEQHLVRRVLAVAQGDTVILHCH